MGKVKDISGEVFSNLLVLEFLEIKNTNSLWLCKCLLCSETTKVSKPNLLSGNTKDCGCKKSEKISNAIRTHGLSKTPTWNSWFKMHRRIKEGEKHSKIYGQITVCEEWDSFDTFLKDMGERPKGTSIDRIDNTKGYYKENCRWATPSVQCRNRGNNVMITHNGETLCAKDWGKKLGMCRSRISKKFKEGVSIEQLLNE
jgi:hypothetical protein